MIIGAGPAGLAAAYELSRHGIKVEIYEASAHVGGMARSIKLFGQTVDCGPHRFFTKNRLVSGFFYEILGNDFVEVKRLTRIYYSGRYFDYPLKPGNVFKKLRLYRVIRIMFSYLWGKLSLNKDIHTLEAWVIQKFGSELYQIFFKNYSEKLWGIPCSRIDADWAAQRIKSLSLWEAGKRILAINQKDKHHSLIEKFDYPKYGSGMLYERARKEIERNEGKVHLNCPVQSLLVENGEVKGIRLVNGSEVEADHVISTMPLTTLVKTLPNLPVAVQQAADQLYFRNTILVYLEVDSNHLFDDNWLYIHSPAVRHGRVTNFRNWSPHLYGDKKTSILCMEFWAFEQDDLWQAEDTILKRLAEKEIRQIDLLGPETGILNAEVLRIPRCYPVYEVGYRQHIDIISSYLRKFSNLQLIGRYGSFKYNNQDHSILMGLLAAKKLLGDDWINLWEVNSDQEYQEE
ncbi:MAG: FAD-dependent oxidoreductase [Cyclobacteriaceae bacterium]